MVAACPSMASRRPGAEEQVDVRRRSDELGAGVAKTAEEARPLLVRRDELREVESQPAVPATGALELRGAFGSEPAGDPDRHGLGAPFDRDVKVQRASLRIRRAEPSSSMRGSRK